MQAINAPSKSPVPFAESGSKNTIPVASQIGVTPGLASFTDGFPPLTMTPLAAGGIPPRGQDFNGILYFLSAATRWQQAGGSYSFDSTFATAIGGYPKGATLVMASGNGYWMNIVENNTTNPDTGGAGWVALPAGIASAAQAQALTENTLSLTPLRLADAFKGSNQALGADGRQTFPGSLKLQWGAISITSVSGGNSVATVAFNQAYTSWRRVVLIERSSASLIQYKAYDNDATLLTGVQVNLVATAGAGGVSVPVAYIAVGV
ncbi:hypothetical protein ACOTBZ_29635 [Achromobacter xylosoxidans]